ncbi:MAG: FMN-binding protein [Polyangia bacterium]
MKTIFNSYLFAAALAVVGGGVVLAERPARAQTTYFTPRAVLAEFFPSSQVVTYQRFELTAEQRERLAQRLGYPPRKPSYTIYIAKTNDQVDGYAVIDEEQGQHLPITFAVKLSKTGAVQRQEILVYRERYGDEVRDPRFRAQFQGKTASDPLRHGEEVIAVSGATISSRAMAIGVRRVLVMVDELILSVKPQPQAKPPISQGATGHGAVTASASG